MWAPGVEYYGSVGRLTNFASFNQQGRQLFAAADVTFPPKWELNFGYGYGFSLAYNKIAKLIPGYRFL